MNPPTQIFQSLKTEKTRRQDKCSYAELPLSLRNFSIMNSRSGSDKNFASSGKSTMTKYPTIESRQVTVPSKMKTRLSTHEVVGKFTPSPATVSSNTVHFTDSAGQKTAKCACEGSR